MDPVRARRILFGGLTTSESAPWKILQERHYQGVLKQGEVEAVEEYKKTNKKTELTPQDWEALTKQFGYVPAVASFVPGAITKALKHGYAVFIDEINAFNPAALTDLTNLLSGQSIKLENGEWISLKDAHPNARLFFAMNPAGPKHPNREPLVRELMSRLSRNMMIVPEMDQEAERNFLAFKLLGEQPTIKLPSGGQFKANPVAALLPEEVQDFAGKELKELLSKYVKARAISRETSQKMEQGTNGDIPRNDTEETWTYDRRDLITFANEFAQILKISTTKAMAANMFQDLVARHCSQHFILYNQERGGE
jgi:MoxR-like ATPase